MRKTYVWRDGRLVEKTKAAPKAGITMVPDIKGYVSPCSEPSDPVWVEGRAARREDLKRNQCREVDPSEYSMMPDHERQARGLGIDVGY